MAGILDGRILRDLFYSSIRILGRDLLIQTEPCENLVVFSESIQESFCKKRVAPTTTLQKL